MNSLLKIRGDVLACLFLVISTLAVYYQVRDHGVINYDDEEYITENLHVRNGLKLDGFVWAFTSTQAANWHPLTWLSHMLDSQIYGTDFGRHHLTNVLFHTLNTLLLFLLFLRMTGVIWQSAFVAALFALHPLHVESVAWLSERKDVLSTFFWMLTMWCYVWYVERKSIKRYLLVLFFFILGLMSKPMLVTLPFVLILMDFWPLNRLTIGNYRLSIKRINLLVLWEKIPLLAFAIASGIVTFIVQQGSGAVPSLHLYPLYVRIANALVSYTSYIGKILWPFNLACFYPYAGKFPWWQIVGASFFFITIFFLTLNKAKRYPWLAVGWLWYVGTLIPVIGLVQVGEQAMADRYTYIPLIGIFLIIAWGLAALAQKLRYKKIGLAILTTFILSASTAITFKQIRHWRNDVTLFEHAIDVTSKNYLAHFNLGVALEKKGRITEAIAHYDEALRIHPYHLDARNNRGLILAGQGRWSEAVQNFSEISRLDPNYLKAHINLGIVKLKQGMTADAINHFKAALRLDPNNAIAHNNLGVALVHKGNIERAVAHFQEALRNKPDYADAKKNLAKMLRSGEMVDANIDEIKKQLLLKK